MKKDPIRCDECGKFIAYKDLDSGAAICHLISYDTEYSREEYEALCPKHNNYYQAKLENQILVATD